MGFDEKQHFKAVSSMKREMVTMTMPVPMTVPMPVPMTVPMMFMTMAIFLAPAS